MEKSAWFLHAFSDASTQYITCGVQKFENILFFTVDIIGNESTIPAVLHNLVEEENYTGRCDKCILSSSFIAKFYSARNDTYVKSIHIRRYSGPRFPTLGLNMKRYSVSLFIQSECGNIHTRITPNTDTFYAVRKLYDFQNCVTEG